jgi:hypothetical protein
LRKRICIRTRGTVKKQYATAKEKEQDTKDAYEGEKPRVTQMPTQGLPALMNNNYSGEGY